MAIYEYYCPTCREKFERRRSMADVAIATECTKGHRAERTITSFAMNRAGATEEPAFEAGGGCCGGGACACGASPN